MELVEKKANEGRLEAVETDPGEEQRKTADVIDLTELLKRSLGGKGKANDKSAGKAPAKPAKPRKSAPAKKATKASQG
jgi:DNA end-binding protein Ku